MCSARRQASTWLLAAVRKARLCSTENGLKDPNTIQEALPGLWEEIHAPCVPGSCYARHFFYKFLTKNSNNSQYQRTPCQPAMCHVAGFEQYLPPPSGQNCYNTMSDFSLVPMTSLKNVQGILFFHRKHFLSVKVPVNGP